jgi:hypothetical protein
MEGNRTFCYHSVDISNNGEREKTMVFKVDTIQPNITGQVSKTKVEPKEKVTINANVTDASSGVDGVFVIIENGKEERINLTKMDNKWSATWEPSEEGTYKLTINAIDRAGNEAIIDAGSVKVEKRGIPGFEYSILILVFIISIFFSMMKRKKKS